MSKNDDDAVVDNKGLPFGMTMSEWFGILFIVGAVIWVFFH